MKTYLVLYPFTSEKVTVNPYSGKQASRESVKDKHFQGAGLYLVKEHLSFYVNAEGYLHREDGPAVVGLGDYEEYFIEGYCFSDLEAYNTGLLQYLINEEKND